MGKQKKTKKISDIFGQNGSFVLSKTGNLVAETFLCIFLCSETFLDKFSLKKPFFAYFFARFCTLFFIEIFQKFAKF